MDRTRWCRTKCRWWSWLPSTARRSGVCTALCEKTIGLLDDLRVQGAKTIALGNAGDQTLAAPGQSDVVGRSIAAADGAAIYVLPMVEVVPLQMFSYFMAVRNGVDVDRPRNLVFH